MLLNHLEGILNYCRNKVRLGVVEAVNGNIKALLRRGRGYRNLNCLLLKAQRLAATRTEFVVLQKISQNARFPSLLDRANNSASLRSSIVAAGNLSTGILAGLETKATWGELVHGSILEEPLADLRGRSVLLATTGQFCAAAALVELDGVARRVVLYPPDQSREYLPYVAKTAEADVLVTDRPELASIDHAIERAILCRRSVTPANSRS